MGFPTSACHWHVFGKPQLGNTIVMKAFPPERWYWWAAVGTQTSGLCQEEEWNRKRSHVEPLSGRCMRRWVLCLKIIKWTKTQHSKSVWHFVADFVCWFLWFSSVSLQLLPLGADICATKYSHIYATKNALNVTGAWHTVNLISKILQSICHFAKLSCIKSFT